MTDAEELAMVAAQEARLQFGAFSNDDGIDIGLALIALGRERTLPIAVDVRRFGHVLFHAALTGSSPDNAQWIERKVRVVERFGHASLYMGADCRVAGRTLEQRFDLPPHLYAAHGGAFPILIRGTGPIGTITVSGLPQREDHALVVSVLEQRLQPG